MLFALLRVLNLILITICSYMAAVAGWEFIHVPERGWWPGFLAIIMLLSAHSYWVDMDDKP